MRRCTLARLWSVFVTMSVFMGSTATVQDLHAGGIACACDEYLRKLDAKEIPVSLRLPKQPTGVLAALDVGDRPILAMAFLQYGKVLGVAEAGPPQRGAGQPGRVLLYDLTGKSPRPIGEIKATTDELISLTAHPLRDDVLITAGGRWDQRLQSWKRTENTWGRVAEVAPFSDWWIRSLAISPDGNTLATVAAPAEGTLRLWNISKDGLQQSRVLDGIPWATSAIAFSSDGKYVAAGTGSGHSHPNDGQILVWDLQNNPPKLVSNISSSDDVSKHPHDVTALIFTAKDNRMVSADQAGQIRTWKVNAAGELKLERQFQTHQRGVRSLHQTRSGQLISSGNDGSVASWGIPTGKLQRRWNFDSQSALITMAPSGRHCAAGLADGRVYILQLPEN